MTCLRDSHLKILAGSWDHENLYHEPVSWSGHPLASGDGLASHFHARLSHPNRLLAFAPECNEIHIPSCIRVWQAHCLADRGESCSGGWRSHLFYRTFDDLHPDTVRFFEFPVAGTVFGSSNFVAISGVTNPIYAT